MMKIIFFLSLLVGHFGYSLDRADELHGAEPVKIPSFKQQRVLVPEKNSYASRVVFMTNTNQVHSFLVVKPVAKNSYEYASFVYESAFYKMSMYIPNQIKTYAFQQMKAINKFSLLKHKDGTFSIRCNYGEASYLAVKPVAPNSYQWAFFATKEYLDADKSLIYKFNLTKSEHGYQLSFNEKFKSYLALGPVSFGSYRGAFFASESYLETHNQGGSTVFDINTGFIATIF